MLEMTLLRAGMAFPLQRRQEMDVMCASDASSAVSGPTQTEIAGTDAGSVCVNVWHDGLDRQVAVRPRLRGSWQSGRLRR